MTKLADVVEATAIRPFQVSVPEAELTELRRRINATRWPEREPVTDASQGVQLATIQKLARYWATDYDWRKVEARLKALPHFITEIDGLDIHFIHVRSKHEGALPLIVTHGWPGSIVEQLKIIEPLTNPTAHGGKASDAFDVVIPSMPGYGYSGKPTTTGWDCPRIARAWVVLMKRLGYTRYVAQGGDWGALITEQMGVLAPPELLGIHTNLPSAVPAEILKALGSGDGAPAGLSADERAAFDRLAFFFTHGLVVCPADGEPPADALRDRGFTGRARRLVPRPRRAELPAHRTRLRRATRGSHARRRARQPHAHLADQHGDFLGSSLSGEQASVLPADGRLHPGCRERLSRRALSGSAELDGAGVSQTDPLQQARQRRALRGLGTAGALLPGAARQLPIAAQLVEAQRARGGTAWQHVVSALGRATVHDYSLISSGGQTHVRATTTRSPPFLGDGRAVAGCVRGLAREIR